MSAPEHEDYQLLMAIRDLTETGIQDALARGEEYSVQEFAGRYVDADSLSIFAMQHAAATLGLATSEEIAQGMDQIQERAQVFVQGFLFGAQFQQTKTPLRKRNARSGDPRKRARA